MRKPTRFILALVIVLSSFALVGHSHALSFFGKSKPIDPPTRVARLSYTQGDVSFSPAAAKNNTWVVGRVNHPLVAGDRLWVDGKSRAELQLGSAAVRITNNTSVRIINLNDQLAQFDLAQGSFILKVRQIKNGQAYEINTPQLAFRITQVGDYRIDVSDKGDATTIIVRKGGGIAYAKNVAYQINGSLAYRFAGKKLQAQAIAVRGLDSFDKWSAERDSRTVRSKSSKYVSPTMIGYEDLDNYGSWRPTAEYGYVWTPNRVRVGWAPYRYGHWSWIAPWGWTWIDDETWGFAPSHYGRWAHYHNSWVWIPGPRTAQASYAPALVVFVGGNNHRIVVNNDPAIAWFPLGPRDVYVPPYTTSETYFTNINANNASVTQVQITTIYKNRNTHITYTNYQINNAITAVPTKTFTQSQSTVKTAIPVTTTVINNAPVTSTATVTTPTAPVGTGYQVTTNKPSENTLQQVPVVVTAPETSVPVQQITPVTTTQPVSMVTGTYNGGEPAAATPATSTSAPVSAVSGTYNGDNSTEQAAVVAKEKAEKETAEKAEAENVAAKAKAEKETADKAEADRAAAIAKEKAEKDSVEKAEADKAAAIAKEKAEKDNAEKETADKAALAAQEEAKHQADEAASAEKEAAKAEAERKATEKEAAQAAEKAEEDQAAAAEKQAAREAEQAAAAERQAAKRAEAEKQAAAERQTAERERAEAERQAAQQAEAQRAAERAQAEQAAAAEAQRAQAEQAAAAEAQRHAAEAAKAEAEKQAAERAEAERKAAEAAAAQPPAEPPAQ